MQYLKLRKTVSFEACLNNILLLARVYFFGLSLRETSLKRCKAVLKFTSPSAKSLPKQWRHKKKQVLDFMLFLTGLFPLIFFLLTLSILLPMRSMVKQNGNTNEQTYNFQTTLREKRC